jgi:antitoxin component YwqK of YwqJK toxin-antitoxin module
MKKFFPIALLVLNSVYAQHQSTPPAVLIEHPGPLAMLLADLHMASPDVESILNNPAINKKQKSGNLVQATSLQEGDKKHFDVHFRKQQLHGLWQTYYSNEQLCDEGTFVKSLPDGEWKMWYPDGRLKVIVNYSAEKFHYIKNDIRRNHPRDKKYQITRLASMNKNIKPYFQPQFPDEPVGTKDLSLLYKIRYNTASDGNSYLPPFKTCLHHGLYISYFENGLVRDSGNYVNGLKHELWRETPDDQTRAIGFYRHGQKDGQWKYYQANGELSFTEIYYQGKLKFTHYFNRR